MPTRASRWLLAICFIAPGAWAQESAPTDSVPSGPLEGPAARGSVPEGPSAPVDDSFQGVGDESPFMNRSLADAPGIPRSWLNSYFNPVPRLEFKAESLWLNPDFGRSVPIARQAQLDPNSSNFTLNDIQVNAKNQFIAAPRLSLEYRHNPFVSFEGVGFYMGGPYQTLNPVGDQDAPIYLTSAAGGLLTNAPASFPSTIDSLRVNWDFQSFGAEFNYWRHMIFVNSIISDFAWGLGGRYFAVHEGVKVNAIDVINSNVGRLSATTYNDLAGPQILAKARLQTPLRWLRFYVDGKIGLMANNVVDKTNILGSDGYDLGHTQQKTQFAPLFEGNFNLEFFVFKNVSIFSGVQLLYADRVDRAGQQIVPNLTQFVSDKKELGSIFMYGPRVGVIISY